VDLSYHCKVHRDQILVLVLELVTRESRQKRGEQVEVSIILSNFVSTKLAFDVHHHCFNQLDIHRVFKKLLSNGVHPLLLRHQDSLDGQHYHTVPSGFLDYLWLRVIQALLVLAEFAWVKEDCLPKKLPHVVCQVSEMKRLECFEVVESENMRRPVKQVVDNTSSNQGFPL